MREQLEPQAEVPLGLATTPEEPPVEVRFHYTEGELAAAVRLHCANLNRGKDVPFTVLLVLLGLLMAGSGELTAAVWLVGGALLLAHVVRFLVTDLMPRRAYRRDPRTRGELFLAFDEEGLTGRSSIGQAKLLWSGVQRVICDDRVYLLYQQQHLFQVVPRRVFESAAEEERFRALLRRHIDDVRLGPPPAREAR